MAAAPDDDARRTLAELEAKLRELERELLRGQDSEPPSTPSQAPTPEPAETAADEPSDPLLTEPPLPLAAPPAAAEPLSAAAPEPEPFPEPAAPTPPEPEPELLPSLDLDALDNARDLLADLRATIDGLGVAAGRITAEARAVVDDHGRTLARLDLAAQAAARAEQAAVQAGRIAGTVVIEVGPFADPRALIELRDALAARPEARDAYVRGVENGRAVIEVHLVPPPTA
jgi:hypothetical protein